MARPFTELPFRRKTSWGMQVDSPGPLPWSLLPSNPSYRRGRPVSWHRRRWIRTCGDLPCFPALVPPQGDVYDSLAALARPGPPLIRKHRCRVNGQLTPHDGPEVGIGKSNPDSVLPVPTSSLSLREWALTKAERSPYSATATLLDAESWTLSPSWGRCSPSLEIV